MGSMEDNLKTGWQEVGVNNRETRIRLGGKGRQGEATWKEVREKSDNSEPYGRRVGDK